MLNEFTITSSIQTKKLGAALAQELRGGEIICLSGELGGGKTTFAQGLLKGLKIKGPYTSPTFAIMKHYRPKTQNLKPSTQNLKPKTRSLNVGSGLWDTGYGILDVYHIDAYRITAKNLLDLGWKDFAGKPDSIVIIEWAERVKKIIPHGALWISFKWISDKERKITLSGKK